jgi:hypothetical protein
VLWSHFFKLRKYSIFLKFQIMKKLEVRVEGGVSSRIPDTSLHVTFLDYDNIVDERLIEELRFLQEEFQIGNFHVLETRNEGRHAVCVDALQFKDILEIVRFSSCDLMFKKAPRINEYRCWVLRYAKKGNRDEPKYLYTVESPYEGQNLQSRCHAKYLLNFGIKIDLKKPFGPEEIEVQDYNTGKRTELETEKEGDE